MHVSTAIHQHTTLNTSHNSQLTTHSHFWTPSRWLPLRRRRRCATAAKKHSVPFLTSRLHPSSSCSISICPSVPLRLIVIFICPHVHMPMSMSMSIVCSIVLRGSSSHLLEEAHRSLHDALAVLTQTVKESSVVFGGGCSETLMSVAVDAEARKTPGKRQLAMESFARALRQLPTIIADNAGFDSAELVAQVRAAHEAGSFRSGIDVRTGTVGNMQELGITEALKLKRQVLLSAAEAAEMILRVDEIIKSAPRSRGGDDCHDH